MEQQEEVAQHTDPDEEEEQPWSAFGWFQKKKIYQYFDRMF